jgi:hypothetical protein
LENLLRPAAVGALVGALGLAMGLDPPFLLDAGGLAP